MSWGRVCDRMLEHPKFVTLDDAGWSLWIRALIFANRYQTDGYLEPTVVQRLGKPRTVRELLRRRLWDHAPGGGYLIHDFLDYNLDHTGKRPTKPAPPRSALSQVRADAGRRGAVKRWRPGDADLPSAHGKPDSNLPGEPMANLPSAGAPDLPNPRSTQRDKSSRPSAGMANTGEFFGNLLTALKSESPEDPT